MVHAALREAIARCGGTLGAGTMRAHVPPPINVPFGSAKPVEHEDLRVIDVGGRADPPADAAFLDGVQRYGVIGCIGLTPVVRGSVAAAAVERHDGTLRTALHRSEEFVVVPRERLPDEAWARLEAAGLPVYDSTEGDRAHPMLDVQHAGRVVEWRREQLEVALACERYGAHPDGWLVVDGALTSLPSLAEHPRVLGVIKSHETQFLDGAAQLRALTLPAGHRTSVFARESADGSQVYTWYLRLWPWEEHDLMHGLIRVERAPLDMVIPEATGISRWLLAERAPLAAPDGRWDRLLYPVRQVETYLRARRGARW